jgi:hypothetical protein
MNIAPFDFAECQCGFSIPIRPSKIPLPNKDQQSSGTGDEAVVVACSQCKRVFEVDQLRSEETLLGFAPANPEAPMRVSQVPIECDRLDCSAQLVVHIMLKSNTTAAELENEKATWRWDEGELTCHRGHVQPYPPYR